MTTQFTRKYLEAFVFSGFWPTDDSSQFIYIYEVDEEKYLYRFDSKKHRTLEDGERITDIDFNKQACWPIKIIGNSLYIISDDNNQENDNIFAIDLSEGKVIKISDNEYTACVRITDSELAYYSSRTKSKKGLFQNEIYIHNLQTGINEYIVNDFNDEYRVGWGEVTPSKNGKFLFLKS